MSPDSQKTPYNPPALEFKSSTFSVPVLVLSSNDLAIIEQQLQAKIRLAPEFFRNSPLVLDVQELNKKDLDIDIAELMEILRKPGLLPIGIRGGSLNQNKKALALQIPVYSINSGNTVAEAQKQKTITPPAPEPKTSTATTTLITHPIRSGQRLYASGDLVILAQVSAGAEILAEGNIHIYGTLRGRALAGVQGNTEARIFCSDLQAELISIAGNYKISEDLQAIARNKPVQMYLQDHTIIIKDI
ncbi:MAG: septum site-determining protein MinC [Methylobacter sp.]|nr:septum site-determining protein MinC [Methylobacter sp.]